MGFTEYVAKQFGEPKGFGGKVSTFIMNRLNQPMYRAVLNEIDNNKKVLDIGFGNGYMLRKLLKAKQSQFFGIDISGDMVKTATRKSKLAIKKGNLKLAKASVDEIPFDEKFDQIYTINTIYFWNDLEKGLREIYDKLNTNGEFLNVCYTKEYLNKIRYTKYGFNKYTEQDLLTATQSVGFNAELIPIQKDKSFFIRAEK